MIHRHYEHGGFALKVSSNGKAKPLDYNSDLAGRSSDQEGIGAALPPDDGAPDTAPAPQPVSEPEATRPASRYGAWRARVGEWFNSLDLTPDLAENIGSRRWFRGLGTMVALGAVAIALWPDFTPLEARSAMPDSPQIRDEFRSQMIMPLALGADSGRRMGPTADVIPLASAGGQFCEYAAPRWRVGN